MFGHYAYKVQHSREKMNKFILVIPIFLALTAGCSTLQYSVSKPEEFVFGESFSTTKERALNVCASVSEKDIVPITAPLAEESQKQIDCFGFIYAGKPRKLELVFQDDQLDLIWILMPSEEKAKVIDELTRLYGEPSMVIDYGTIYLSANAAYRNAPSEVLFASKRQVEVMLKMLSRTE